jgi:ABC-type multidrug transport system ATPase subunit
LGKILVLVYSFQELLSTKTGILKDRTRILATHNISFLPDVDYIIVMKDGHINAQGTYKELMGAGGAFAEFINEHSNYQEGETEVGEKTNYQVTMKQNVFLSFQRNRGYNNLECSTQVCSSLTCKS